MDRMGGGDLGGSDEQFALTREDGMSREGMTLRLDQLQAGDRFMRKYGLEKHGIYTVLSSGHVLGVRVRNEAGKVGELYCWELVKVLS